MLKFCSLCISQGHVASMCPWGHRETRPTQTQARPDLGSGRTPAVRRNASQRSSTFSHGNADSTSINNAHESQQFVNSNPHTTQSVHTGLHTSPSSEWPPAARSVAEPLVGSLPRTSLVTPPGPYPEGDDRPASAILSPATVLNPNSLLPQLPPLAAAAASSYIPATSTSSRPPKRHDHMSISSTSDTSHACNSKEAHTQDVSSPAVVSPHPTNKSILLKGKKKKKSVSFNLPAQSNLSANSEFWNSISSHIATLGQGPPSQSDASLPAPSAVGGIQTPPNPMIQDQPNHSGEESSGSSIAADSPPSSPNALSMQSRPMCYASEGEEAISELTPMLGHNTDEILVRRSHSSKRNKRLPDQPLKVQLRVRKDPNPISQ